jgi:transcription elongation factor Elf1
MAHNIDPDALVNVPCPRCSEKMEVTVATIESSPRLVCDKCGATFAINAQKVMDKIRAAQELAEYERRKRGV